MTRPARRVPGDLTHDWESQAEQYEYRSDVPRVGDGITLWWVPRNEAPVPIGCLLYWAPPAQSSSILAGVRPSYKAQVAELVGILNYYPQGSPYGEEPHDTLTLVRPDRRREGIGTALLREALRRWPDIDLRAQAYTSAGWELARTLLED